MRTRAERRHNNKRVINKRLGYVDKNWNKTTQLKQYNRLSKSNGINCGNPNCLFCSNHRKIWKELTIHEKSFYQKELIDDDI